MKVANEFPKLTIKDYKLAIVGEAPGATEALQGRPFVGAAGRFLNAVLARQNIVRDACFVGNIAQLQPPNNDISRFAWEGPEIQEGLQQLREDLNSYNPNLVLLLGATALRAACGDTRSITSWRGSLFMSDLLMDRPVKCLATYHPAYVLRDYTTYPVLCFDVRRAREEATTPELHLPQRTLLVDLSPEEVLAQLDKVLVEKPTIAVDIEGGVGTLQCVGIATSPHHAFIVPFNETFWQDLEPLVWRKLAQLLGDPTIPKVFQNGLYDLFVLRYGYRLEVRGVRDDIMLKHWEALCELPKSLAFQASIYTKEPYYKSERFTEDARQLHLYCCKDAAVTHEINTVLEKALQGGAYEHYRFNVALLEPVLYMQLRGIRYDKTKATARLEELRRQTFRLQHVLNLVAGMELPKDQAEWFETCKRVFCRQRDVAKVRSHADLWSYAKLAYAGAAARAAELLAKPLDFAALGELATLTELGLNVESNKQLCAFLYDELGMPPQYKKEHGVRTDRLTTDVLALLHLHKATNDPVIQLILTIRSLRTRTEALETTTDEDGRIRCSYNIVGTETGRFTCYASVTGSGFNLQTVTKADRDLFVADPDHWFFQCDLSGADGWTVAAHCRACGDGTMLDDYRFGLKPAKIIALLYEHGEKVLALSREELARMCAGVDTEHWLYFACKRVQHGSNYGMRAQTMAEQILKDSYKLYKAPVWVPVNVCERLQQLYFMRYPGVRRWHEQLRARLSKNNWLVSASGHKRVFFGRKDENSTLQQACAEEPQNNTTYATSLALHRLWNDPENRISTADGSLRLRIEPLHQIHDALCGQFRKEDTEWAVRKIRSYFDNTLTIAGIPIVIPFEGAYGPSWGKLDAGKI